MHTDPSQASPDEPGAPPPRSSVEILAADEMDASVVRRLVEAYNRTDPDAISDLLAEEAAIRVEWQGADPVVLAGIRDALDTMVERRRAWKRDWIEAERVQGAPAGVTIAGRWRGHSARTGQWTTMAFEAEGRLQDGRVAGLEVVVSRPARAGGRPTRRLGGR